MSSVTDPAQAILLMVNWLGLIMMPIMAGLFLAVGVYKYSKGESMERCDRCHGRNQHLWPHALCGVLCRNARSKLGVRHILERAPERDKLGCECDLARLRRHRGGARRIFV